MQIGNLGLGALAAATLGGLMEIPRRRGKRMSHDESFRDFKKATMQGVPTSKRAKVKAARRQNVQRQIAAKYA